MANPIQARRDERIDLREPLRSHVPTDAGFDWFLGLQGKVYREVKHRRTLEFSTGGRRYFIKIHLGCGWGEIIKDWLSGRAPVPGADNEWMAIARLEADGIPTMTLAGTGWRGRNPARRESFVITEALEGMISLETLVMDWGGRKGDARFQLKRALVARLAEAARRFHATGMNHRDFYLCHFLVRDRDWNAWQAGDDLALHVIDLHRVQLRDRVPYRWRVKDVAGLLCSAFDAGVTPGDVARFIEGYQGKPWSGSDAGERRFWGDVWRRAVSLYRGYNRREPPAVWGR
jgi:heptose I phosphotransferase